MQEEKRAGYGSNNISVSFWDVTFRETHHPASMTFVRSFGEVRCRTVL
jgi:hypothetical protein